MPQRSRTGLWVALVVFLISATALAALIVQRNRPPLITEISPQAVGPGDILTLRGSNFGPAPGGVELSGSSVPEDLYQSWSSTEIEVQVPGDFSSGLVRVLSRDKRSSGRFLAATMDLPQISEPELDVGRPYVERIVPAQPRVGDVVSIHGRNFGEVQNDGRVYFSWQGDTTLQSIPALKEPGSYLQWSERTIQVRVPDGAIPGPVTVGQEGLVGNPVVADIIATSGTKSYIDKATYALHYGLTISVGEPVARSEPVPSEEPAEQLAATGDLIVLPPLENTIYLWVPRVYPVPEQRNRQILAAAPAPHADLPPGQWLYRFRNVQEVAVAEHSVLFDRYVVRTEILPNRVIWDYDVTSDFYTHYTRSTPSVPVDSDEVQSLALRTVGRERNPYSRARYVYNYVTGSIGYSQDATASVLDGIASSEASSLGMALIYVALARAASVPARTVGGYRIDENDALYRHHWAEFYLSGFGWVPVDPVYGAGHLVAPGRDQEADESFDAKDFYFGSLDNRRITLTVGEPHLRPFRQGNDVAPIDTSSFWRHAGKEITPRGADIAVVPSEAVLLGVY